MVESNDPFANRRKYPRYKVSEVEDIKFLLRQPKGDVQLVVLSQGGCAICAPSKEITLEENQRLFFDVMWKPVVSEAVELQGRVANINTVQIGDKEVTVFGVEFVDTHQERVTPIVEKIEHMAKEGEAKVSEV